MKITNDPVLQKVFDIKEELIELQSKTIKYLTERYNDDQTQIAWLRKENEKLNKYISDWLDTNVYSIKKED